MKKKLTIDEKLNKRVFKSPSKFVWWCLNHLLVRPILEPKFNVSYKTIDPLPKEGPCFLIYNHQSRADYIWTCRYAGNRPINYVVGYNESFRKKFDFVFRILKIIPKKNFTSDLNGLRGITSIIKRGGIVCFSPEGMSSIVGHNQPVVPGTGKFFKKFGVPVYMVHIKGGYLTNHKVCLDDRLGKVETELTKILDKDIMDKMDADQIEDLVNEKLYQDDYEYGKEIHVKWKTKGRIAHHLHDICYRCPICGEEFSMEGSGDTLICHKCGNGVKIDDYYDFHPIKEGTKFPESPSKWVDEERQIVIKDIRKDPNYFVEIDCKLGKLPLYKPCKNNETSIPCGEGLLRVDHDGIHFKGTKDGNEFKFDLSYEIYYSLVIVTDVTFLSLYVNGEYLEFYPSKPVVGKMLLVTEEMHRLHVNKWKNLSQFDYMYKDLDK